MKMTIRTTGFADLEKALAQIEKEATQKALLRRSLIKAAEPIEKRAAALAPDDKTDGKTRIKIGTGTRLSRRQKKLHKKLFPSEKAAVEVFVGAAPHPVAIYQEFGTDPHIAGGKFKGALHPGHKAQPFMRPAWDAEARPTLERLKVLLGKAIARSAARAAAKSKRGGK